MIKKTYVVPHEIFIAFLAMNRFSEKNLSQNMYKRMWRRGYNNALNDVFNFFRLSPNIPTLDSLNRISLRSHN